MAKTFIDTNVLVYMLDTRRPSKQERCIALVEGLLREGSAVVSTQTLQELFVAAVSKLHMDPLFVKGFIKRIANCEVVTVTQELIQSAIDLCVQGRLSFWDALVVAAAESANCSVLLTEDLNTGQVVRSVKVVSPFEQ